MKKFDTLYARNSNGKINEWLIIADDEGVIRISEGLIDGTATTTDRRCKGKNIGKMNETSPFEQACKEAEGRWEKKRKQGYKSAKDLDIQIKIHQEFNVVTTDYVFLDNLEKALPINRTDAENRSKPMKAQSYYKTKTVDGKLIKTNEPRLKFPCYGQPKLNGFRVISRVEKIEEGEGLFKTEVLKPTFRSKEGLRYTVLEHIEPEIEPIINNLSSILKIAPKDIALDGEMYIHKEILSEISSAVRKRNDKTKKLMFCMFDLAVENIPQNKRINGLMELIKIYSFEKEVVGIVNSVIINSNEEAQDFTDKCIKEGYEGAIFRDMKALYQFGKRPQTMTKLKRSEDKEFKIIDVKGGDNTPDLAVFVCIQEEGLPFDCTPEGSQEVKREYLTNKNKYIGKMLTIRFFERTKDNKPFHAIGTVIRDYE